MTIPAWQCKNAYWYTLANKEGGSSVAEPASALTTYAFNGLLPPTVPALPATT